MPRALYTVWKNVYKRAPTSGELSRGETEVFTQFGRMCEKLGIEVIPASSPQAKGRVESCGLDKGRLTRSQITRGMIQALIVFPRYSSACGKRSLVNRIVRVEILEYVVVVEERDPHSRGGPRVRGHATIQRGRRGRVYANQHCV